MKRRNIWAYSTADIYNRILKIRGMESLLGSNGLNKTESEHSNACSLLIFALLVTLSLHGIFLGLLLLEVTQWKPKMW